MQTRGRETHDYENKNGLLNSFLLKPTREDKEHKLSQLHIGKSLSPLKMSSRVSDSFQQLNLFKSDVKHFSFTLKTLIVLEIFKVLSLLFGHAEKQLDQKVNFKIYDLTTRETIIVTHILPNLSRSKDGKTMKFGQLLEYNMGHIFHEKSFTKCGGEN